MTTQDGETILLVPKRALRSTCLALQKKLGEEKGEKRQGLRRTAADRYKLANYQKRVWADRYTAARNSNKALDYSALSKTTHFSAFKDNPDELQRHEPALLKELYKVYLAEQALKGDAHTQTAGSSSPMLSQHDGVEIERRDIQAAQQLTATRNQAASALDQAPRPEAPVSVQAQTPDTAQVEDGSVQSHPLRGGYAHREHSISQALQQFGEKLEEEKKKGDRQLEEEQARSRALEEQLAATAKELAELRNDRSGDDKCTVIAHEWKKTAAKLAEERAISSGLRNKLAHVEDELNLSKQSVTTHADNLVKAQANHAKTLQDVHDDMNNLTKELDERKTKLDDREKEVATREKIMEIKEEELQVRAKELQSHEAKLKEEGQRLQNETNRLQREREQFNADKEKREKSSQEKQQGNRFSLTQAKMLNEMKRQTRLLKERFENNGCPPAFEELQATRNQVEDERAAMQADQDRVRSELESMKAALEAVKRENSGLQDTIAQLELYLSMFKHSAVTEKAIEEFTEWNAVIRDGKPLRFCFRV